MTEKVGVKKYSIEGLRHFYEEVFQYFDVPAADAQRAAAVLSAADRRGIDSHGVARLKTYFDLLRLGRINPHPNIEVVRETPSTATVDGDNGLGLVVGPRANELAMEKAEAVGSGWVSVRNTNHYGIAGYYVLEALKKDLIGMSMTNSTKLVAPHRGAERMLGTNPIATAFPGKEEPPIVIDMATSCVAYGKVEIKRRKLEQMPVGWAIDRDGRSTQDPEAMIEGGAQLPLGSDEERSGHKGYCLASMVDVLTCVLSGANWGPFAPPFALRQDVPEESVGKGIGHFFGAWQIDGFREPDAFKRQIDKWVRTFRATEPAPGFDEVLIPGDPERMAEERRKAEGVPVLGPVVEDMQEIVEHTAIPHPE